MSLSKSFQNKNRNSLPENYMADACHTRKETPQCICRDGSLTLEAAFVIPCIICFFVTILFFFRVMQVQLAIQEAADHTARKLAVYMAVGYKKEIWENKAAVKLLLLKELKNSDVTDTYLKGGTSGINIAKSEWSKEDVCLKIEYRFRCPIRFFGLLELSASSLAVSRKWTGWKNKQDSNDTTDVWVYIAKTGSTYHKSDDCTHLLLSIRSVEESSLANIRNENGGTYKKCSFCAKVNNKWNHVYITNQGDRFHYDLNCSGIKRTVSKIRLSEAGGRKACSRCYRRTK